MKHEKVLSDPNIHRWRILNDRIIAKYGNDIPKHIFRALDKCRRTIINKYQTPEECRYMIVDHTGVRIASGEYWYLKELVDTFNLSVDLMKFNKLNPKAGWVCEETLYIYP